MKKDSIRKNVSNISTAEEVKNLSSSDLLLKLFSGLKPRAKEILIKRFGLDGKPKQTLEKIGRSYGITRERVRQIEAAALAELKKSEKYKYITPIEETLENLLDKHGKIMEHNKLIEELKEYLKEKNIHENVIEFILKISDKFIGVDESEDFKRGWAIKGAPLDHPHYIINSFVDVLNQDGRTYPENEAIEAILKHKDVERLDEDYKNRKAVLSYLSLSKKVLKNPFNEWGLSHWKEITPKGVKDKAYLVLKKHNKPLHFREIADLINKKYLNQRKANPQTTHNELIKDDRFVLVGRGIYGLKEWGYKPGTVADIIEDLLRESGRPLSRDEIVKNVLKQRLVRKNTVILALQNRDRFQRVGEGVYTLGSNK